MNLRTVFPVLLVVLVLLQACSNKPSAVLPPEMMSRMLTDIHTAEVYSTLVTRDSLHPASERNQDSLARYYREIFAHYQVSEGQFVQSMNWYKAHPEQLDSIYVRILPQLSELDAVYQRR